MSARPQTQPAADPAATTVDQRNPWLGLASFTEETRAYFFGREEEVAELARRVQRKLLTVLFGQSGLGKTSILRAGLVPRLRSQGYCPIYVRIDYGKESPAPAEQIKQAISRTARHSGEWSQAGVAVEGESLWEFLHHRDDVLRDESGATLIPLLIFDQFEEIFTLAQSDEFGRARAARFLDELADLVENRPPKSLEAKLDEDESAAERFDFGRGDYRVLIALREDYLAPLEGLKKAMPSISQNRLRLAPMTGDQALAAVLRPGKGLVTDDVAGAIVRFVAGGAELAHAEVEPSLLSLICRELNDTRIAQGRDEISLDLLAGSHASILSNFYERSLADQKPAVRQVIEDELLTASGFRENIAEERLLGRLNSVGAAPDALATLVNRRLLRIEERLDVRRVELTHDVLCGVVKSSRDLRREREAREATERLLAEQHTRELAARRALVRARQIAIGCTVLAIGAIAAAVLAYFSSQRAHRAEMEAEQTRAVSEQARIQAEQLMGYLTDDFVRELQSFGRLDVVAEFAKRQIDYFHALPPALKDTDTTRNGALAMVQYARAMRSLGKLDTGSATVAEAIQLLERLRSGGDASEATTIALALGYTAQAQILDNRNDAGGPVAGKRAAELLRPLAEARNATAAARRAYVEVLIRIAFEQQGGNQNEEAVRTGQKAMQLAADLGARDLSNIDMGADYAEAGAWLVSALTNLGRNEEARRSGEEAMAVADKVLERRPGYRLALHAEQVIEGDLTQVATNALNPAEALRFAERQVQIGQSLLNLDPGNVVSINNMGVAHQSLGDALWAVGRVRDAIPPYSKSLDDYAKATVGGAGFFLIHGYDVAQTANKQSMIGDQAEAAATIASGEPFLAALRRSEPPGSITVTLCEAMQQLAAAGTAFQRDDLAEARRMARQAAQALEATKPSGGIQEFQKFISLYVIYGIAGRTDYLLGDYAGAERAERAAMDSRKHSSPIEAVADKRDMGELSTWLAMALARQGRHAEAAQAIAPVVKFQRGLAARNHGDEWQNVELAAALYAQALTDKNRGTALLNEAAAKLDSLPATMRNLHDVRQWRERIRAAERGA
ncbi:MAG: hypothetical protein NVS9B2_08070 [Steroidobacteraceae bacterium]